VWCSSLFTGKRKGKEHTGAKVTKCALVAFLPTPPTRSAPGMSDTAWKMATIRARLFRWLVVFFSRPIRLSDGAAILRLFKKRRAAAIEPEDKNDFRPTRPSSFRDDPSRDHWPDRRPVAAIEISEQPLDTLPAELQDELRQTQPPKP